jgi:hypothetical protein
VASNRKEHSGPAQEPALTIEIQENNKNEEQLPASADFQSMKQTTLTG